MNTQMTILMIALTSWTCHAGTFSGERDITATLTVGAASSCTSAVTEFATKNDLPNLTEIPIASVSVTCPGAGWTYLGLVGEDGLVAVVLSNTPSNHINSAQGPYWLQTLGDWDLTTFQWLNIFIDTSNGTAIEEFSPPAQNGLPDSVIALAKGVGSTGKFTIDIKGSCPTSTCRLKTGTYTYHMKMFGYWQ